MDICSCFISGQITSEIETINTKCPAVSFQFRTILDASGTEIASEFKVLCVEAAANTLQSLGITKDAQILLEGARIYLKKDKETGVQNTWLRVQYANQIRLLSVLDEGIIQADEKYI